MLVLASRSPTRKTLLEGVGLRFSVRTADIDERTIEQGLLAQGADRETVALALAKAKALAVSAIEPDAVVIGADQTLDCDTLDIHKPASRAQAAAQLRLLAGKSHRLHAAVALAKAGKLLWSTVDSATLTLRSFTETELATVLDLEGDAILSSVGGYRLEGPSARLFSTIAGDYFTVLGLPLLALLEGLRVHIPQALEPAP